MPRRSRQSTSEEEPIRAVSIPKMTLGWELEACRYASDTPQGVIQERDASVSGDGAEYKIAPGYVNAPASNLEALRRLTADPQLHVDRSCGFHVHVGLANGQRISAREKKQWAGMMVALARNVETFAYRAVPESRRTNNYCRSWISNNSAVSEFRYSRTKYSNAPMRYHWVNVVEMFRPGGIGTVEIRLLGSTKRYAYLLGWIGICHLMARAAWRLVQDPSAMSRETAELKEEFRRIEVDLLPPQNNAVAYRTAVDLIHESRLLSDCAGLYDRLVTAADEADRDRVNGRRISDVNQAHAMAIAQERSDIYEDDAHRMAIVEEIERCHAQAHAMNMRPARRRVARQIMQDVLVEAYQEAPIQGFNPEAFEIVPTGGN